MSKSYSSIRGTHDFSPSESLLFNHITQRARELFKVFGYQEVILPILEEEGLFTRSIGESSDIVERQMFKLEGKDRIVLRPEATAQVIRYYIEQALYKQSDFHKFFYIGPMFRGERPQKGRLRQFNHLGMEAIGSGSPYIDAEVIALSLRILDTIGIQEHELKINSLGCAGDKNKFSQQLKDALLGRKNRLCEVCQKRLERNPLRVLDCKEEACKKVASSLLLDNNLCLSCREHFEAVLSLLKQLQIPYTHQPHLVRGLDYYTNTVFEIISKRLGSQDALGAGGRYDNLVSNLGGPCVPAIGFALGIERLILVLGRVSGMEKIKVFIATTSKALLPQAFTILQSLRTEGITSDMDYCGKSLKAQLRFSQKRGARFVLLLGEEELSSNLVILKDMEKSTQEKIPRENAITTIKNYLAKQA